MTTQRELQYRTLNELVASASVDLRSFYSDGVIEMAELIKIAQECNYELGLQIQQTKETILDVEHGRAKLPADFSFLNFAFLCHQHTQVSELWPDGLVKEEILLPNAQTTINLTSCPCWTVVSTGVQTQVTYCDGTTASVYFPPNTDGTTSTTKLCATSITPHAGLTISTTSFCYNDPNTATYTCDKPINCGCNDVAIPCAAQPNPNPWGQNKVRTICDGTVGIQIQQACGRQVRHYTRFEPLFLEPCRRASAFASNNQFRPTGNIAFIRDNFLEISTGHNWDHNHDMEPGIHRSECGKVYLSYQGLLEDEQGNLLVLDHPKINIYYEYKVKYQILLNLYINGEPDLERRLQLVERKVTQYTQDAMNIAYMPDFKVIQQTYRRERQIQNEKHVAPFSRYFGIHKLSAEFDYLVNGHKRE